MTRLKKIWPALLATFIIGYSGGAQATSFNLGSISGPGVFSVGYTKDPGPFTDLYFFTIDPGVSLDFSAFVFNAFGRHSAIGDMDGTLSDASGVILDADAIDNGDPMFPAPHRELTFPQTLLGPGNYKMAIFGTVFSDVGISADYSGTVTFAATPLPGALLLMLTALGGVGLLGRLRRRTSA
jgi:hypothetical protein